jgi:hypothetical protein
MKISGSAHQQKKQEPASPLKQPTQQLEKPKWLVGRRSTITEGLARKPHGTSQERKSRVGINPYFSNGDSPNLRMNIHR